MKANNLPHFPISVDEIASPQVKTLFRRYNKLEGYGKYCFLRIIIAQEEDCILRTNDEDLKMSVAADLDFELEEFDAFIEFLVTRCKLLVAVDNGVTTEDLQYQLTIVNEARGKERKRKQDYRNKIKNSSSETNELSRGTNVLSDTINDSSHGKTGISGERKEKEIKEKEKEVEVEEKKDETDISATTAATDFFSLNEENTVGKPLQEPAPDAPILNFVDIKDWETWCARYAPVILKMQNQMNYIQLSGLVSKYGSEAMKRNAHQMNNKVGLLDKHASVFSALKSFIDNEKPLPQKANSSGFDLSIFSQGELVERLNRIDKETAKEMGLSAHDRVTERELDLFRRNVFREDMFNSIEEYNKALINRYETGSKYMTAEQRLLAEELLNTKLIL